MFISYERTGTFYRKKRKSKKYIWKKKKKTRMEAFVFSSVPRAFQPLPVCLVSPPPPAGGAEGRRTRT
jgi:hypothetical protein